MSQMTATNTMWSERQARFWLLVLLVVVTADMGLFRAPALAESMSTTPVPNMPYQYHGLQRVGTVVVLIIGAVIVPLGLLGFSVLLINCCYKTWKKSRSADTASDNKTGGDPSTIEPTQTSSIFMYIGPQDGDEIKLKPTGGAV